jgi:ABC-2 type transport system ATP-binding protein
MDDGFAIKVDHVSKTFRLPLEKQTSLKGVLINFFRGGKRRYMKQKALNNVSFEIKKGEFFGIVGRNGSGKSTMLKLLAGIYSPSEGVIKINGKLTPFIELGVGFNPELTGRENVFLNGALLGFNRKEMQAMYDDIVSFAELHKFMDQKLKNYSSGMQVRLAFSIAIRAKSDILLIDEVLAVGDVAFQEKCFDVFRTIKSEGRTVVFVSHDLNGLQEFCDRAVLIDYGDQINIGNTENIIMEYETRMAKDNSNAAAAQYGDRPGSGKYIVEKVDVSDATGKPINSMKVGDEFTVSVQYKRNEPVEELICGVSIVDANGISIIGPNTKEAGFKLTRKDLEASNKIVAKFNNNPLSPGIYTVTVGLFSENGTSPYDYLTSATSFKIIGKARHGKVTTEPNWSIS